MGSGSDLEQFASSPCNFLQEVRGIRPVVQPIDLLHVVQFDPIEECWDVIFQSLKPLSTNLRETLDQL